MEILCYSKELEFKIRSARNAILSGTELGRQVPICEELQFLKSFIDFSRTFAMENSTL